jgi:hypothetical protein
VSAGQRPARARLRYADAAPRAAALRSAIERLWVVTGTAPAPARAEHIVPDGCPELIVHLADPFERRVRGRWTRQPRAFLAGTLTRPWHVRPGRRVRTLGVRFRPGQVRAQCDLHQLTATAREVPLPLLEGEAAARALDARLAAAGRSTAASAAAVVRVLTSWRFVRSS